jgi:hypothetical protein
LSRSIALLLLLAGCACSGAPPKTIAPAVRDDAKPTEANDAQPTAPDGGTAMTQTYDLQAIRNDNIKFGTYRPPDAQFATLDRQIMVIEPPDAVTLVKSGNVAVFDQLLPLLDDPDRIWAAEVILAALTGNEAEIVQTFENDQETFKKTKAARGARARWQQWLDEYRPRMKWDDKFHRFVIE